MQVRKEVKRVLKYLRSIGDERVLDSIRRDFRMMIRNEEFVLDGEKTIREDFYQGWTDEELLYICREMRWKC